MTPPAADKQVDAILNLVAHKLVKETVGHLSRDACRAVFTVGREDLRRRLTETAIQQYVHTTPGGADGFYLVTVRGGYRTYVSEYGHHPIDPRWHESFEDAREAFIDYLLVGQGLVDVVTD